MPKSTRVAAQRRVGHAALTAALLLCGASLAACGSKAPQEGRVASLEALDALDAHAQGAAGRGQTPVSGHVFLLAQVPGAHVALWAVDAASGTRLHRLAETSTLDDGSFALDAGTYEGPALLEARAPASLAVLALPLRELGLGAAVTEVVLTPVTTVMAAYAGYRAGTGVGWQRAVVEAEAALNEHFFAIDHAHVLPEPWPADAGQAGRSCDLAQPARRASLIARGLAVFADARLSRSASPQPDAEALGKLLAFIARDVAADGLVDGRPAEQGPGGPYVQVATEVLRDGLAGAIAAFLDGPSNYSGCRASDAQSLLDHLQRSNNPPLLARNVEPPAPLPVVPPAPQVACEGADETGEAVALDGVLRGPVTVRCRWQATGGASNLRFDAGTESAWVARVASASLDELTLEVDTVGIEEHTGRHAAAVTLCGDDAHGRSVCRVITVQFRNTPPLLALAYPDGTSFVHDAEVAWYEPNKGLTLRASAGEGAAKLRVFINEKLNAEHELVSGGDNNQTSIRDLAIIPDGCDAEQKLEVVAVDRAGNSTRKTASLRCLSRHPKLIPLDTRYSPDFSVDSPATGNEGWSDRHISTLHKLYNRLDYAPAFNVDIEAQNLPVLRFYVDDADPKKLAGSPRLSYSYVRLGKDRGEQEASAREWRRLCRGKDGTYSLPISYQTLLPQSLLDQGTLSARTQNHLARRNFDDVHEIDFRVENDAGLHQDRSYRFRLDLRSPKVWVHSFEYSPWVKSLPYENAVETLKNWPAIVTAKAEWPLGCAEYSLFPCDQVVLRAKVLLQADAQTIFIDQWDTGRHLLEYPQWDRMLSACGPGISDNRRKGNNVAWSELRGCHAPVKNHFAKNRRSVLYLDSKEFSAGQQLVKMDSRETKMTVADGVAQTFSFEFDLRNEAKDWKLTGGRNGCFSLYHMASELELHDFAFDTHVLSNDYFVAGFAATATVPLPSQIAVEVAPGVPSPLGVVVVNEGGQFSHAWARGPDKSCRVGWNTKSRSLGRQHHQEP